MREAERIVKQITVTNRERETIAERKSENNRRKEGKKESKMPDEMNRGKEW
jgi:hypothetical protein